MGNPDSASAQHEQQDAEPAREEAHVPSFPPQQVSETPVPYPREEPAVMFPPETPVPYPPEQNQLHHQQQPAMSFPPQSPVSYPPEQNLPRQQHQQTAVPFPPQTPVSYPPEQHQPQQPAMTFPPQSPNIYLPAQNQPHQQQQQPAMSFPPQSPNPYLPAQNQPHHQQQQPAMPFAQSPNPYPPAPNQPHHHHQQPPDAHFYYNPHQTPRTNWSTNFFDCFDDPTNALITFFFPCVTFGQIAEILDEGQTSCGTAGVLYGAIMCVILAPCIYSCGYRSKLRSRYNLLETPGPDWFVHFFCEYCALCQAYRELSNRGWILPIGWQENMARKSAKMAMVPPTHQVMMHNQ